MDLNPIRDVPSQLLLWQMDHGVTVCKDSVDFMRQPDVPKEDVRAKEQLQEDIMVLSTSRGWAGARLTLHGV